MNPAATTELKSEEPKAESYEEGYPQGVRLGMITLVLCLAIFVVALDNSIIAVAIPKITDQFHSLDDVGWYGSAYFLTTASFQLLFGRLYTLLPVKRVFIFAIALFDLGSLVCALAPTSNALIVGRAIAGLGNAGVLNGALVIIAHTVPLHKRPVYTGVIGSMYGIANVSGPLLGGAFTDKVSWRWCFYINLPLTSAVIALITLLFKAPGVRAERESISCKSRFQQLDPWGTLAFIPAIVCLLLALQWGGSTYAWNDPRIIVLFVLFAFLIGIFAAIQIRRQERATIPPRIVRKRTILAASWFILCLGGCLNAVTYFLPIYFQAIKAVSPVSSGIDTLPTVLSTSLATLTSGTLITHLGYYTPVMYISSVLTAIGAGLLATLKPSTPAAKWIGYQVVYGAGGGLGVQMATIAAQAVLGVEDIPTGVAITMFMQIIGGALFISVAQTIFQNRLIAGLSRTLPLIDPEVIIKAGATALRDTVPAAMLPKVLDVYDQAIVGVFYLCAALAGVAVFGAMASEWVDLRAVDRSANR